MKEMTYRQFLDCLQRFGHLSQEEMVLQMQDQSMTMFETIFAKIICDAARGNEDARKVLLERLWGKVKDEIKYEGLYAEREQVAKLSVPELLLLVKSNFPEIVEINP